MYLQSVEEKMLHNKEWLAFFHNIENKQDLLNLFVSYLSADDFVKSRLLPTLAKDKDEILKSQVVSQRFLNATTKKTNNFPCITAKGKCSSLLK